MVRIVEELSENSSSHFSMQNGMKGTLYICETYKLKMYAYVQQIFFFSQSCSCNVCPDKQ